MSAARSVPRQRTAPAGRLLAWGLRATAAGVLLLALAWWMAASPRLHGAAAGLRTPGLWLLGAGGLLLALHGLWPHKGKAGKTTADTACDAPTPPATRWGPDVFPTIEWRRFEAVCEALFAQDGWRTRAQSHGADGGVDIWLHRPDPHEPAVVVQCKHWHARPVGVREMREFFGVMASHRLTYGIYVTSARYTTEALRFAQANGIDAIDGPALLALILERPRAQQQTLLAVAQEGDYWRPTCARCGIKLVPRTASRDGTRFWGCRNYPDCTLTLPMGHPAPETRH